MSPRLREMFWVFLYPLAVVWAGVALARRRWGRGRKRYQPGVPTVVVGNLHSGGSGKTPLVAAIATHFRERRPVVVSRGYRASASRRGARVDVTSPEGPSLFGDEPWMLAKRTGLPVFIGARRDRALARAEAEAQPGLFVLDDAFQNFSFRHDVDLVAVSTRHSLAEPFCLPLGELREPLSAVAAASAVILVPGPQAQRDAEWVEFFKSQHPTLPCFVAAPQFEGLWDAAGPVQLGVGVRWAGFCGIAGPERFAASLSPAVQPVFFEAFADHHAYSGADVERLIERRCREKVDRLVTTEKDWHKAAPGFALRGESLAYAKIGYVLPEPFWAFLQSRLEQAWRSD